MSLALIIVAWCGVPLVAGIVIVALRRPRHHSPQDPCFKCGYDLTEIIRNARCCPECGYSSGGRVVIRSASSGLAKLTDACALVIVWWVMVSLTIGGIAWVYLAGVKIAEWQIPH